MRREVEAKRTATARRRDSGDNEDSQGCEQPHREQPLVPRPRDVVPRQRHWIVALLKHAAEPIVTKLE
jgi:hypothetical protein